VKSGSDWPPANKDFWQEGVLADARKQIAAAKGTPIEWHFPSKDKANAVSALFQDSGIIEIEVKVTRKAKP
jgi:hypothetical protein